MSNFYGAYSGKEARNLSIVTGSYRTLREARATITNVANPRRRKRGLGPITKIKECGRNLRVIAIHPVVVDTPAPPVKIAQLTQLLLF